MCLLTQEVSAWCPHRRLLSRAGTTQRGQVGLLGVDRGELLLVLLLLVEQLFSLNLGYILINHGLGVLITLVHTHAFRRQFFLERHDLWVHFKTESA